MLEFVADTDLDLVIDADMKLAKKEKILREHGEE